MADIGYKAWGDKQDPMTAEPTVVFTLNAYTVRDGIPCLTPQCCSEKEIDTFVNSLVKQLESARRKAKKDLRDRLKARKK